MDRKNSVESALEEVSVFTENLIFGVPSKLFFFLFLFAGVSWVQLGFIFSLIVFVSALVFLVRIHKDDPDGFKVLLSFYADRTTGFDSATNSFIYFRED